MSGIEPGKSASDLIMKAELPVVSQRGSGRTLLWTTEDNPLFDAGYANLTTSFIGTYSYLENFVFICLHMPLCYLIILFTFKFIFFKI